jgi:hypothetical protein
MSNNEEISLSFSVHFYYSEDLNQTREEKYRGQKTVALVTISFSERGGYFYLFVAVFSV